MDYTKNMTMVTVPAGVLTQSITISIVDDKIVECIEIFNVTISSVTTCGINIGNVYNTEVRINDDGRYHIPYTSKHSRGKTFAVHQQCALCRENFCGLQP